MKYLAEFPMKYGDIARRVFKSKSEAIKCAVNHIVKCQSNERETAEVWQIDDNGHKEKVFELTE